jgi:hypothetical protein
MLQSADSSPRSKPTVIEIDRTDVASKWSIFEALWDVDHPVWGREFANALRRRAELGQQQLWISSNDGRAIGGAVSELQSMPYGLTCAVWPILGSGIELNAIGGIILEIEAYARNKGCIAIEVRYYLPNRGAPDAGGYRKASESFIKDLRGPLS